MGYKIGSFNLRNIGLTALSDKNERDIEKIAEIIKGEEFDIVALQEVLSEGKAFTSENYAKKSILWELGPDWEFAWAEAKTRRSTINDPRNEGFAFVWNKRRMRLSTATLEDGTVRTFTPRICEVKEVDGHQMMRKPYYARFTPQGTFASSLFEIRLLCIHTYFGRTDGVFDREIRQNEIDTLLTEVYPQISDRVYKSNMPSYTFVLGDYNAELYRPWHDQLQRSKKPLYIKDVVTASRWDDMAIKTVQDQLTTLKSGGDEAEGGTNSRYSHNYDHFSYEDSDRYDELNIRCKRVDAVRKYENDDADKYRKEVSDHIPILLSIDLN